MSNLGPIWVDFSPHGPHLSRFGNHLGTNSFKLGPDNRYAGSCGGASHPRKHATPNVALKKTGGGRGGEGVGGGVRGGAVFSRARHKRIYVPTCTLQAASSKGAAASASTKLTEGLVRSIRPVVAL